MEDGIVKKIRALLAKARGTENEHEAALFASKAAEMLQQHNLTEAALHTPEAEEAMIKLDIVSVDTNPWRWAIWDAVANLYFCDTYRSRYIDSSQRMRAKIVIVGRPHNAAIVQSMGEYLLKTTLRLAKEYSPLRKDRLQFEKGCGMRLAQRVRAMIPDYKKPQVLGSGNNLPALYKSELELAGEIVNKHTNGKVSSSHHRPGGQAVRDGRNAADKVHLGKQIGVAGARHLLT